MSYHKTIYEIRDLLDKNYISYKFFEHEPVRTSEEAFRERSDYKLSQGAKALILRLKEKSGEKSFIMTVIPGDQKLDGKKLIKILGVKNVSFATEEESKHITEGIEFGGVPPFGNLFGLRVIVDKKLIENDEIIFNCGDRSASIAMRTKDYFDLVKPTTEMITR